MSMGDDRQMAEQESKHRGERVAVAVPPPSYILHAWKRSDLIAQMVASMIPDDASDPKALRNYIWRAHRILDMAESMESGMWGSKA